MLTLLLDEHLSPAIAERIAAKDRTVRVASIHRWHNGEFLRTDDDVILEAAYRDQTTPLRSTRFHGHRDVSSARSAKFGADSLNCGMPSSE